MPVKYLEELSDVAMYGLWEITETAMELLAQIKLSDSELEQYQTFTNHTRRTHWLSYRALLKQMIPNETFTLCYDAHGKLFVAENTFQLSVSHSGNYSAAIIHRNRSVGIDIERIAHRIVRIKERFLSEQEVGEMPFDTSNAALTGYWCAKEALYKYYGKEGLDFRKNLRIEPFLLGRDSKIIGQICSRTINERLTLKYRLIDEYLMVYIVHE
jgi:phosphopantetheinyl transferase